MGAKPGRNGARDRAPDPALEDLPPDAAERFERLRNLRREIAREEQVPAYIVFDDKTLRRIAMHRPRTLEALGDIHGIGPAKKERFGARFLAALDDESA
jgi:ATP-dependent DNA helicase RecQ